MSTDMNGAEKKVREAVNLIIETMSDFDDSTKIRVLRTVGTFFDVDGVNLSRNPVSVGGDESKDKNAIRAHQFGTSKELSPKDFLFQKDPKTDVDRVACLAYYLHNFQNVKSYKTGDITKLNTEAAQVKFANTAYAVSNATVAGILASAGKNLKQLTALGERYVDALPDYDAARAVKKRIVGRRRKTKKPQTRKGSGQNTVNSRI